MKIVCLILLGLGLACLGYNYIELQPLLDSEWIPSVVKGSYRDQSDITGLAGTILFAASAAFAFIANKKDEGKLFLFIGLGSLVLGLLTFLVAFGRVL